MPLLKVGGFILHSETKASDSIQLSSGLQGKAGASLGMQWLDNQLLKKLQRPLEQGRDNSCYISCCVLMDEQGPTECTCQLQQRLN